MKGSFSHKQEHTVYSNCFITVKHVQKEQMFEMHHASCYFVANTFHRASTCQLTAVQKVIVILEAVIFRLMD